MNLRAGLRRMRRGWRFAIDEVWDIELTSLSALSRFGVRVLRVVNLVFKGFREDECPLHASALTFSSLMSVVPILALSLALARGFGDADTAKEKIRNAVSDWTQGFKTLPTVVTNAAEAMPAPAEDSTAMAREENGNISPDALAAEITRIVDTGFEKVENISFKALGGVGLVVLFWMVIQVLGKVETSFNRIWGVVVSRTLWRKFTDYLSVLVILPLLAVAASSIPVVDFATRHLDDGSAELVRAFLGSAVLRDLTVLTMTSLCFAFVIMFMPNTRVKVGPGLAGGLVTALLFIGWLHLCAALQVGVGRAGKLYGSFAVVPIILAWVHVSWQIVFFGAEVAFAIQNCSTYRMEQGAHRASVRARMILSLAVVREAAKALVGKSPSFDAGGFARERKVPVRFLNDVVEELVQQGLLGELSQKSQGYALLKAPASLRVREVLDGVVTSGVGPENLGLQCADPRIEDIVQRATQGMDTALEQMTVEDLLKT